MYFLYCFEDEKKILPENMASSNKTKYLLSFCKKDRLREIDLLVETKERVLCHIYERKLRNMWPQLHKVIAKFDATKHMKGSVSF